MVTWLTFGYSTAKDKRCKDPQIIRGNREGWKVPSVSTICLRMCCLYYVIPFSLQMKLKKVRLCKIQASHEIKIQTLLISVKNQTPSKKGEYNSHSKINLQIQMLFLPTFRFVVFIWISLVYFFLNITVENKTMSPFDFSSGQGGTRKIWIHLRMNWF